MDKKELLKDFLEKKYINADLFNFLINSDFLVAPASTKYHGSFEGGLWLHSVAVMNNLVDFTKKLNLSWKAERSPYIVGLLHDVCKINSYIWDNEKNSYKYNTEKKETGHGSLSVETIEKYMPLTEEEKLCIRYHMGAYETDDWNEYGKSIETYKTVLFTHTADMLASRQDV